MYADPKTPGWQRDAIWTAGTILVVAALLLAAALAWSRASDATSGTEALETGLRLTLLPGEAGRNGGADTATTLAVRTESEIVPGEPFEALPGSGVVIDPTELSGFDVQAALDRIAGVWSLLLLDEGREALLRRIDDAGLRSQLTRTIDGPGTDLVDAELADEMMPSGLDNGSRMANWPLQAQREPGEPVQPIVGVFVFFDADELRPLSERQIGARVVRRLAEIAVTEGAEVGRVAITNDNLAVRYEQGLSGAREALHELMVAMLAGGSEEIETRLDEARAVQAGETAEVPGLSGLAASAELAGLPVDAANERIVEELARRTWQSGTTVLDELLAGDPRSERLAAARPVLAPFTRVGHDRARRLAWSSGAVALIAAALLAVLARGAGRLARPGIALLLAAAPGAAVAWGATRAADAGEPPPLPSGARIEGVFAELAGLLRHLVASLPPGMAEDALRVHLVLGGVGAVALVVAALVSLGGAVRPRRRGYL